MSLGGKTTETQQIDPDLKAAALEQLAMAKRVGQLGFVPYKGATVAGMQPGQIAAIQNMNAGLDAFGFGGTPLPAAGDLSPYAMYQEQLAQMAPGQRAFIDSMFINPMTGAAPTIQFGAPLTDPLPSASPATVERGGGRDRDVGGAGRSSSGSRSGGYNSVRDRFDGGGPNRSGSTFSGGPMSDKLNRAGINPVDGRGKNAGGPGRTSKYGK